MTKSHAVLVRIGPKRVIEKYDKSDFCKPLFIHKFDIVLITFLTEFLTENIRLSKNAYKLHYILQVKAEVVKIAKNGYYKSLRT